MDSLYNIGTAILLGVLDSIKGIAVVFYLDKEANRKSLQPRPGRATKESLSTPVAFPQQQQPSATTTKLSSTVNKDNGGGGKRKEESKVLHRVLQCCLLNGGVFMLSILLFEYGVLPGLNFFLSYLFSNSGTVSTVWGWMKPSLSLLFHSFWVAPLFLLSKIVNSLWFQDIADSAYKFRKGRPQLISSISKLIADTLISLLIQVLFLLQSTVIKYLPIPVPFACSILYMVHMSLLCSLYAFEYKWFNMGWELHKRLTYIETNWPFFIGFGLPLAILSEMPNSLVISGCVFSVLFPLFILSANEATPKVSVCETPLKLFSLVVAITNALFSSRTKLGKAALSTPISGSPAAGPPGMMMGRGMTPPSSSTPTPSLNFQLNQQQRMRQQQQHHRQHRHSSPVPSAVGSTGSGAGMGLVMTPQQQQAALNRSFRR
ncbi:LOW QUALITY PROTEIN: etoposide-induced protein 2.4 homolog [Culex quinquefasciatus]|uniref:LOW QUALITY PROTEIN: etoposide-induced protein 2.4 homolog n=1 Tax=Culex quinquefasciatus TaxID=7176 RepID=UPI0018E3060C|nr:LOW QUALITY PROTEIN: etoposide-induced protein 2.4 homolog [Culex quinquefasciatus]